jgi:response regulator RpfG family c-di-GMP phosphodiesterase
MATSTKTPNYTPEQETAMQASYLAGVTVDAIALSLGKSARSVTAKLSRLGVYKAKVYTTKTGEKAQKKDETADAIGAVLKMTEAEIESLTKANKTALVKIFTALANSVPMTPENSPAE